VCSVTGVILCVVGRREHYVFHLVFHNFINYVNSDFSSPVPMNIYCLWASKIGSYSPLKKYGGGRRGGRGETGERVVKKGEVLKVNCFGIHYTYCVQYLVYFSPASEMLGVKIKKKASIFKVASHILYMYIQYILTSRYTPLYCNSLSKIKFSIILKITTLDIVSMVTEIFSVSVPFLATICDRLEV